MYTYKYTHIHRCIYPYMYIYIYTHYMYIHIYICMGICVCLFIYICAYTYTYTYIHIYTSRERFALSLSLLCVCVSAYGLPQGPTEPYDWGHVPYQTICACALLFAMDSGFAVFSFQVSSGIRRQEGERSSKQNEPKIWGQTPCPVLTPIWCIYRS